MFVNLPCLQIIYLRTVYHIYSQLMNNWALYFYFLVLELLQAYDQLLLNLLLVNFIFVLLSIK